MLRALRSAPDPWDFIIIGGGATGLGTAVEAASRGYRTLLLEQHDFAKGTSSRSTKLVHGGVRYLRQGNLPLILEAPKERGLLLKNAPHLAWRMPFIVPTYAWWEGPFYGLGLKLYDRLAGRRSLGRSRYLSEDETLARLPTLDPEGLRGGVMYYDGQFDDARLAINLARTAVEQEATVLNYVGVTGLLKDGLKDKEGRKGGGKVHGVTARDMETGATYELSARIVINATGVFADGIRRMDDPSAAPMIRPSRGVHVVLDRSFLPGEAALMVPKTDDGRVLFAIPWHGRVVVGTTDTPAQRAALEPRPTGEELDFLLTHAARYLTKAPAPEDVLSTFSGLRPLVSDSPVKGPLAGGGGKDTSDGDTAALSRDHVLRIAPSGLVTITGGKWTTYRRMAEDTIDEAAKRAGLEGRPSVTGELPLHGYHRSAEQFGDLRSYGADALAVRRLLREEARYADPLHPEWPTRAGEVVWAARHEMARTVEDVLARRTRLLFLDARASMATAPRVAALLAEELGRDETWQAEQVAAYRSLARGYLIQPADTPVAASEKA